MGAAQGVSFEATGAAPLRNAYTHLKGERVLTHNLILGVGPVTAGILGVTLQSLVSIDPERYFGVNK
jgi:hypothetical protein